MTNEGFFDLYEEIHVDIIFHLLDLFLLFYVRDVCIVCIDCFHFIIRSWLFSFYSKKAHHKVSFACLK